MSRFLKCLGWVIGCQISIFGATAAYDQFAGSLIRNILDSTQLLNYILMGYFVIPITLLIVIYPIVLRIAEEMSWRTWCASLIYVGPAKSVNQAKIFPRHGMDLAYVKLKRPLNYPPTIWRPDMGGKEITNDADTYLRKLIDVPKWKKFHCGFIVSGMASIGKAMFP